MPNQFCPKCKTQVNYNPRYPNYICRSCASLDKTDEDGYLLNFSNLSISGGLKITYWKDGKLVKEETSKSFKLCFIDNEKYIVTEARFGGIVIQKEE